MEPIIYNLCSNSHYNNGIVEFDLKNNGSYYYTISLKQVEFNNSVVNFHKGIVCKLITNINNVYFECYLTNDYDRVNIDLDELYKTVIEMLQHSYYYNESNEKINIDLLSAPYNFNCGFEHNAAIFYLTSIQHFQIEILNYDFSMLIGYNGKTDFIRDSYDILPQSSPESLYKSSSNSISLTNFGFSINILSSNFGYNINNINIMKDKELTPLQFYDEIITEKINTYKQNGLYGICKTVGNFSSNLGNDSVTRVNFSTNYIINLQQLNKNMFTMVDVNFQPVHFIGPVLFQIIVQNNGNSLYHQFGKLKKNNDHYKKYDNKKYKSKFIKQNK